MVNMGEVAYALEIKFLREYSKMLFFFLKRMTLKGLWITKYVQLWPC